MPIEKHEETVDFLLEVQSCFPGALSSETEISSKHNTLLEEMIVNKTREVISGVVENYKLSSKSESLEEELDELIQCEEITKELASACGYIGSKGDSLQIELVKNAICSILENTVSNVYQMEQYQYPAVLIYHACSLSLQCTKNWKKLHDFMNFKVNDRFGDTQRAVDILAPTLWAGSQRSFWRTLDGIQPVYTPFHEHLVDTMSKWGENFIFVNRDMKNISLLNEALTSIVFFENWSFDELQKETEIEKKGRTHGPQDPACRPIYVPIGRAARDPDYFRNTIPKIMDSDIRKELCMSGFGKHEEGFIPKALEYHTIVIRDCRPDSAFDQHEETVGLAADWLENKHEVLSMLHP